MTKTYVSLSVKVFGVLAPLAGLLFAGLVPLNAAPLVPGKAAVAEVVAGQGLEVTKVHGRRGGIRIYIGRGYPYYGYRRYGYRHYYYPRYRYYRYRPYGYYRSHRKYRRWRKHRRLRRHLRRYYW